MLFDFMYYNPTRIHFGKDSLSSLKEEIENFGELYFYYMEKTL